MGVAGTLFYVFCSACGTGGWVLVSWRFRLVGAGFV